ncbi:MAG: ECs_2282 family putative zinc-binding protein [Methylocystis sp.]|uniref:ECs_2282 family putative zinc-binding protein n=1 Tax=Methylocystis sp. TaxID=1911079 RepID=UPI003DA4E186
MNTSYECPSCGHETVFYVKTKTEFKSYDDLIGAVCIICGYTLTDENIKRYVRDIAIKCLQERLKKTGF